MSRIPTSALVLGLAGLLPFLWGAVTLVSTDLAEFGVRTFGPRFIGPHVQLFYGTIILSFMSGVLWGFAVRADKQHAPLCFGLSVVPALWVFFMTGRGMASDSINLICGFLAVLLIDLAFSRWGLTPPWWMRLRSFLTAVVVICIGVSAL